MNRVPLHPRGAVASQVSVRSGANSAQAGDIFHELAPTMQLFDLSERELYLTEELLAMYPFVGENRAQRTAIALAVLALMLAQREGSSCVPLEGDSGLILQLRKLIALCELNIPVKEVSRAIAHLTAGQLGSPVGFREARMPLVIDRDALYTEKARWLESQVAHGLRRRLLIATDATESSSNVVDDVVNRSGGLSLSSEQLAAVRKAVSQPFTVITGGPGTGKTAVTAAIVRALLQLDPRPLALAAPTGKAAQRMSEVIAAQLANVSQPNQWEQRTIAKPLVAQTLHRLLGIAGNFERSQVHALLPVSAVIVDESSMLDLEMTAALLASLADNTKLILLGDSHQLPAVQAGQILADLSRLGLTKLGDRPSPVALLTHSYRMDAASSGGAAILLAAQAVDRGEVALLVGGKVPLARKHNAVTAIEFNGVEWFELGASAATAAALGTESSLTTALSRAWQQALTDAELGGTTLPTLRWSQAGLEHADIAALDAAFSARNRSKILTVTRSHVTGAEHINQLCHEFAASKWRGFGRSAGADLYRGDETVRYIPGEPVMIVANDYHRGLWNGDQGIIADLAIGDSIVRRAWFPIAGRWTPFALEALADRLTLAWAMTVHKSQGSEMEQVAVVLPMHATPLSSKELLYTAVTRAKRSCLLIGSKESLLACKRGVLRSSRLMERIENV